MRRATPIRDEDIFEVAIDRFWNAPGGNDLGVKAVVEFCRSVFLDKADDAMREQALRLTDLRIALNDIIALDHHWHGPESRATEIARAALLRDDDTTMSNEREIGWLIERKYPTNSIGTTESRWYAERANGDHWWTTVPNEAKRFATKAEADSYPVYQMIASDHAISITEHVWIKGSTSSEGLTP